MLLFVRMLLVAMFSGCRELIGADTHICYGFPIIVPRIRCERLLAHDGLLRLVALATSPQWTKELENQILRAILRGVDITGV